MSGAWESWLLSNCFSELLFRQQINPCLVKTYWACKNHAGHQGSSPKKLMKHECLVKLVRVRKKPSKNLKRNQWSQMVLGYLFKDAQISVHYSRFLVLKEKQSERSIVKFLINIFEDQLDEFYQNICLLIHCISKWISRAKLSTRINSPF